METLQRPPDIEAFKEGTKRLRNLYWMNRMEYRLIEDIECFD